jgi:hypothetical protein
MAVYLGFRLMLSTDEITESGLACNINVLCVNLSMHINRTLGSVFTIVKLCFWNNL